MKKTLSNILFVFLLFGVLFTTGCGTQNDMQTSVLSTGENIMSEINAKDAFQKINNVENLKLVDVRTLEEYEESHINNSILIPLDTIDQSALDKENIQKEDEIILYCRSGRRSLEAYEKLKGLGYKNIVSMAGGINEWKSLGFEVI